MDILKSQMKDWIGFQRRLAVTAAVWHSSQVHKSGARQLQLSIVCGETVNVSMSLSCDNSPIDWRSPTKKNNNGQLLCKEAVSKMKVMFMILKPTQNSSTAYYHLSTKWQRQQPQGEHGMELAKQLPSLSVTLQHE